MKYLLALGVLPGMVASATGSVGYYAVNFEN
jgi:hypothetical protein